MRAGKKKPQTHNPATHHASRELFSFILAGQTPCGRSSWPPARPRRRCSQYESSGLPDEPYHLPGKLCPASLQTAHVPQASRAEPIESKKWVLLAMVVDDVNLILVVENRGAPGHTGGLGVKLRDGHGVK